MAEFKLSVVREPPTPDEFKTLVLEAKVGGLALFSSDPQPGYQAQAQAHLYQLYLNQLGGLEQSLRRYHQQPAGDAYFGPRKAALQMAVSQCDTIIATVHDRILKAGPLKRLLLRQSPQEKALVDTLLGMRIACDAKYNLLLGLQRFLTDRNLTDMAGVVAGGLGRQGQELRAISNAHLSEYFNPFHFTSHDDLGNALFKDWLGEVRGWRAGDAQPPFAFPVYLEARCRYPFSEETDIHIYQGARNNVFYDGRGERSDYHVVAWEGHLWRHGLDEGRYCRELLDIGRLAGEGEKMTFPAFVIDSDENIYVFPHQSGFLHHSSPTGGLPVICAGLLEVYEGKVVQIKDESGHYKPTPRHMLNGIRVLHAQGVFDPRAVARFSYAPGSPSLDVARLLRAESEGLTAEALRAALLTTQEIRMASGGLRYGAGMAGFDPQHFAELVQSFLDPQWESTVQAGLQSDYADVMGHMVARRPKQAMTWSRPRSNGLRPLTDMRPGAVPPGLAPPAPTTPPQARKRRNGVLGARPPSLPL